MTKKQFIELVGEDPVDVLGQDWENEVTEWLDVNGYTHEGHEVGGCYECKDGL